MFLILEICVKHYTDLYYLLLNLDITYYADISQSFFDSELFIMVWYRVFIDTSES